MAEILVLVELDEDGVRKGTLEALTVARVLGEPAAVVIGPPGGAPEISEVLAEYGAVTITLAECGDVDAYFVAPKAEILGELVESRAPAAVVIPASLECKEIAARLALKTGSGFLTDVTQIASDGTATQEVFGGAVIVRSRVTTGTPIYVLRHNAVIAQPAPAAGTEHVLGVSLSETAKQTRVLDRVAPDKSSRPPLGEASIVVAGGRGVGSVKGFALVEALADCLGGAVGASGGAVNAGFYSPAVKLGQTGKSVSPQLYIAVGISGVIHHRVGVQTSSTIVAVNKDPDAPIFALADLGVVGDWSSIVSAATEMIKTLRSGEQYPSDHYQEPNQEHKGVTCGRER